MSATWGTDRVPELHSLFLLGTLLLGSCWSGLSSEKSGSDSADVKGYFIVGEWNEILCVKSVKNISTRKELNTSHGTKEHVEW